MATGEQGREEQDEWQEADVNDRLEWFLNNLCRLVDFAHDARIAQALENLLEHASSIIIYSDTDEDLTTYHVSARMRDTGQTITAVRQDLLDALRCGYGSEKKKRCMGKCGLLRPLSMFSKDRSTRDGRNRYCRLCERARVKEWEQRGGKRQEPRVIRYKRCKGPCGRSKPDYHFGADASREDGKCIYCKACRKGRRGEKA